MAQNIADIITNPLLWIFLCVVIIVIIYSFRSYVISLITSLFFDYGIDAGLSFGDNFVAGLGVIGVDIGDWIAAGLLFIKYRKQVGLGWAILFVAEAANFGISVIPGAGEIAETIFNLFPIVSIVIMYKQWRANQIYLPVQEYYSFLKDEKPDIAKRMDADVQQIKQLYNACSYQELLKLGRGIKEGLFGEIKQVIMEKLNNAQQHIITILQKDVEQGTGDSHKQDIEKITAAIQQTIGEIEDDWKQADTDANQILNGVRGLR